MESPTQDESIQVGREWPAGWCVARNKGLLSTAVAVAPRLPASASVVRVSNAEADRSAVPNSIWLIVAYSRGSNVEGA